VGLVFSCTNEWGFGFLCPEMGLAGESGWDVRRAGRLHELLLGVQRGYWGVLKDVSHNKGSNLMLCR